MWSISAETFKWPWLVHCLIRVSLGCISQLILGYIYYKEFGFLAYGGLFLSPLISNKRGDIDVISWMLSNFGLPNKVSILSLFIFFSIYHKTSQIKIVYIYHLVNHSRILKKFKEFTCNSIKFSTVRGFDLFF